MLGNSFQCKDDPAQSYFSKSYLKNAPSAPKSLRLDFYN